MPATDLAEFVTPFLAQAVYRRAQAAQAFARQRPGHDGLKLWIRRGVRAARARDPRLLLMLDRGAEELRRLNDAQQSRFAQEGFARQEFTELSTWRNAYEVADQGEERKGASLEIFGHLLGAAYEAAYHGRHLPTDAFRI